jgi:DNA polymerase-3 subunit epsilon
MDFVALDFETANRYRSSVCSVGMVEVSKGKIVKEHYTLINPLQEFDPFNTRIHGITKNQIRYAPTFEEYWKEMKPILQDKMVVAHNATFDISVLKNTLERFNLDLPSLTFTCTVEISRIVWDNLDNHKLGTLADYHQISFEHHNALEDARAAAILLNKAIKQTTTTDVIDLSQHLRLSLGKMSGGRVYNVKKIKMKTNSSIKKQSTVMLEESIQLYEFALKHSLKISYPYIKLAAIYEKQGLSEQEIRVWRQAIYIFDNAQDSEIENREKQLDSFYKKLDEASERKRVKSNSNE